LAGRGRDRQRDSRCDGGADVVYPDHLPTRMTSMKSMLTCWPLPSRCASLLLLALLTCAGAFAQNTPRVQVFGGYSYFRFDSTRIGFADHSNLNGATLSFSYNFLRNLGVTVDGGAYYGNANSFYTVMAGPQLTFGAAHGSVFGHALFGVGKDRVDIGFGDSDRERAYAIGGGYDYPVSDRFAVRVLQVDYVNTRVFNTTEGNIRAAIGLVYRWGGNK
jgi:hypothetical protein